MLSNMKACDSSIVEHVLAFHSLEQLLLHACFEWYTIESRRGARPESAIEKKIF